MSNPLSVTRKRYAQLHIAVFLFGFTAILGKLITLSGYALVWYRLAIVGVVFALFPGLLAKTLAIPNRDKWRIACVGIVVALHWVTFYEAIKYSNASITLACLATSTLFTAFFEPAIRGGKPQAAEIVIGLIVAVGIALIARLIDISALMGIVRTSAVAPPDMTLGIIIALTSAALTALFGVLNKVLVMRTGYEVMSITQIELAAGLLFISVFLPVYVHFFPEKAAIPVGWDWLWLLLLGVLCTNVAYIFSMNALKTVSAYESALAINLEPVYGIAMAYFLFKDEQLDGQFYVGTAIILLSVVGHQAWKMWRK